MVFMKKTSYHHHRFHPDIMKQAIWLYIIRFVDDYPMTVTGEIQKFIMREMMIKDATTCEYVELKQSPIASSIPNRK